VSAAAGLLVTGCRSDERRVVVHEPAATYSPTGPVVVTAEPPPPRHETVGCADRPAGLGPRLLVLRKQSLDMDPGTLGSPATSHGNLCARTLGPAWKWLGVDPWLLGMTADDVRRIRTP